MSCPGDLELARAVSVGPDERLAQHLEACAPCRASWQATLDAIALAREVDASLPSTERREEVRTAILATRIARPTAMRRAPYVVAAGLAAAAVVALVLARSDDAPAMPAAHGTIHADPGAQFTTSAPPDEIVRLVEGSLDVEVSPLLAGERFRVIVGDGEVEVRGTRFVVTARGDHLVAVVVQHGIVDVRIAGRELVRLGEGQSWHVSVATVETAPPPRADPAPRAVVDRRPDRPRAVVVPKPDPVVPHVPPPAEVAYGEAWDAMRAREFARAASEFGRVVALGGGLVEDASYWHAVALARGGSRDAAIVAFRGYLDAYAQSPRAGEASAMLGWLLVDARQLVEAERRFRAAADDSSPTVRTSARNGLAALRAHD
jgi:hypothetical protein